MTKDCSHYMKSDWVGCNDGLYGDGVSFLYTQKTQFLLITGKLHV